MYCCVCACCWCLVAVLQGNAYYAVPVLVSPSTMLDVQGAAEFTAERLQRLQHFPCINTTAGTTPPTFCAEFSGPAVCGSPTHAAVEDGSNVPQCVATGSSIVLNVLNPETCTAGVPPVQYAADITTWLSEQMQIVAGSKWKGIVAQATSSDATQKPVVSVAYASDSTAEWQLVWHMRTPSSQDVGPVLGNCYGVQALSACGTEGSSCKHSVLPEAVKLL